MKLSNRQLDPRRLDLSMTSMIDVVFLLLIFFLVTTTFIQPEKEIAANIQVNEQEASTDSSLTDPAIVDVLMNGDSVLFRIGAVRTNDLREVERILSAFDDKSKGAFVRVAGSVPYEAAAQAIGACKAAGFPSVSYLPLPG